MKSASSVECKTNWNERTKKKKGKHENEMRINRSSRRRDNNMHRHFLMIINYAIVVLAGFNKSDKAKTREKKREIK